MGRRHLRSGDLSGCPGLKGELGVAASKLTGLGSSATTLPGSHARVAFAGTRERMLTMWVLLSARMRTWLLVALALPLARLLIRRLADVADRHDARSARALRRADSALTAVSRRGKR